MALWTQELGGERFPLFLSSLSIRALQWLHDGVRVGREFDKKVHSRDIRIPVLLRHKKPRRMQKVALPSFPFLFSPPLELSFAFCVQTGFSFPLFFSSRHEMCIPEFYAALFLSIFPTVSHVGERTPPTYLSKRRCLAVCLCVRLLKFRLPRPRKKSFVGKKGRKKKPTRSLYQSH